MLLPDHIAFLAAVAGGALLIMGIRKPGLMLIGPAVMRWLLWPLLEPVAEEAWNRFWPLILVAAPIVTVFGTVGAVHGVVALFYGPEAAGHVTGTLLTRVLDLIGRGLAWLVAVPFRLGRAILGPR